MSRKYFAVIVSLDVTPENEARLLLTHGTYGKFEPRYHHAGKAYHLWATTRFGEDEAKALARKAMKTGDFVEVLYVCEGGERQPD
jgi:hypothetical protein